MVSRSLINHLTAKLFFSKLQFPVTEQVVSFLVSHLSLCSFHGGQTSQGKCAGVVAAVEALYDTGVSPRVASGRTRGGNVPKFLPILPEIAKEESSL